MLVLVAWVTRVLISLAGGIGAGCLTFGVMAMTGDPAHYDFQHMDRHGPPLGPFVLSVGVGFVTIALLLLLLSRNTLSAPAGRE